MTKKTQKTPALDTSFSHLDYLEEIEGAQAIAFAKKNNAISDARLKTDKRYKKTYLDILKIVSAKDKLPMFFILDNKICSFWQDNVHIKGILRKTSVTSFNSGKPKWTTVLDIDLLAKKENENWVYKGIDCLEPDYDICFIRLSRGGKDATVLREFNLKNRTFVKDGFFIPESKSQVAWIDKNTILVGDATANSPLTTSGYPSQIKVLKRGETLDSTKVIFKAASLNSMSAYAWVKSVNNKRLIVLTDQISFFEAQYYTYDLMSGELKPIAIPTTASIEGVTDQHLFFSVREKFKDYPAGTLLSVLISEISQKKPEIQSVFIPTQDSFYEYATFSKNHIWISVLNDVKRKLLKLKVKSDTWRPEAFDTENTDGNIGISAVDDQSQHIYFSYSDFLTPASIMYLDESKAKKAQTVLKTPARFKSSPYQVSQYKVKSKDGTIVPYYIVSSKKINLNGKNPTLLYGYGGFEIAMTPAYMGATGKVWLEKGGVYVLANIRGGGEYGPNWHRSVLRENRHKAYEDFFAIAEDLIARKVTSPRHLGIRGGSNGGLLTSVAFTQKPELFNAVISEVPLANMLEYHRWLAGASWMEEYGNPEDPKMREYLLSYSPLHNLKKDKKYPEVFYLTSTKDDRVSPAHARQMVARMQELGHPVLYNENTDGGHGRASNMKDLAEFLALEFTYLYQKLF